MTEKPKESACEHNLYQITTPNGHHVVKGTCIHLGADRFEVREGKNIVAVAFSSGVMIHKPLKQEVGEC